MLNRRLIVKAIFSCLYLFLLGSTSAVDEIWQEQERLSHQFELKGSWAVDTLIESKEVETVSGSLRWVVQGARYFADIRDPQSTIPNRKLPSRITVVSDDAHELACIFDITQFPKDGCRIFAYPHSVNGARYHYPFFQHNLRGASSMFASKPLGIQMAPKLDKSVGSQEIEFSIGPMNYFVTLQPRIYERLTLCKVYSKERNELVSKIEQRFDESQPKIPRQIISTNFRSGGALFQRLVLNIELFDPSVEIALDQFTASALDACVGPIVHGNTLNTVYIANTARDGIDISKKRAISDFLDEVKEKSLVREGAPSPHSWYHPSALFLLGSLCVFIGAIGWYVRRIGKWR